MKDYTPVYASRDEWLRRFKENWEKHAFLLDLEEFGVDEFPPHAAEA